MEHIPARLVQALGLVAVVLASLAQPSSLGATDLGPDAARRLSLTAEERSFIAAHPVVRVLSDPGWAPLEYADASGERHGISMELLGIIGPMVGLSFEFPDVGTWSKGLSALARGELDMASSIVDTEQRRAYLDFTPVYIELRNVIYGNVDSP